MWKAPNQHCQRTELGANSTRAQGPKRATIRILGGMGGDSFGKKYFCGEKMGEINKSP